MLTKSSQNGTPLPDKTENRCYSAAEFDDLVATFATPFPDKDCSARDHAVAGNTLTLSATCKGEAPQGGTLSVKQDGSYVFEDAKRFTGSLTTTFALPNQPSIVFSLSKLAEHVGPCPMGIDSMKPIMVGSAKLPGNASMICAAARNFAHQIAACPVSIALRSPQVVVSR